MFVLFFSYCFTESMMTPGLTVFCSAAVAGSRHIVNMTELLFAMVPRGTAAARRIWGNGTSRTGRAGFKQTLDLFPPPPCLCSSHRNHFQLAVEVQDERGVVPRR